MAQEVIYEDGSSIQTFEDGSTIVTDSNGKLTSTPSLPDPVQASPNTSSFIEKAATFATDSASSAVVC